MSHDQIDCSKLVWSAFKDVGLQYSKGQIPTWRWAENHPGFLQVDTPLPGDVVLFPGHMGLYVSPGVFLGAQSSGVAVAFFGPNGHPWGASKPVLGFYRWQGFQ